MGPGMLLVNRSLFLGAPCFSLTFSTRNEAFEKNDGSLPLVNLMDCRDKGTWPYQSCLPVAALSPIHVFEVDHGLDKIDKEFVIKFILLLKTKIKK